MERVWTQDEIKHLLEVNDKMVCRSLIKLYELQTESERDTGSTHVHNGVGFNGPDAPIMTSFAKFFKKTGFLTDKQMAICRKKLMKYSKQLVRLANA